MHAPASSRAPRVPGCSAWQSPHCRTRSHCLGGPVSVPADGHLGCFHFLAAGSNSARDHSHALRCTLLGGPALISAGRAPRRGIAESWGDSTFNLFKDGPTVSPRGGPVSRSISRVGGPISVRPANTGRHQAFRLLPFGGHTSLCVGPCFPGGRRGRTSFPTLMGRVCVSSGETCLQILCPFLKTRLSFHY